MRLQLREISVEEELEQMNLPTEATKLVEMLAEYRKEQIENRYDMTFVYMQLKEKGGEFWANYDCRNVEELLAKFNLPVGVTFAKWEVLVRHFDRETVVVAGSKILETMVSLVADFQSDSEVRKRDYQAIFLLYQEGFETFEKAEFLRTVYKYVNSQYNSKQALEDKKPQLAPIGMKVKRDVKKPTSSKPQFVTRLEPAAGTFQKAIDRIDYLEQLLTQNNIVYSRRPIELEFGDRKLKKAA